MASMPANGQETQPMPTANNAQPIEITATKTVEWLRDQSQYVARENVIVTQGAMSIHSDLLTADYREGAETSMEIYQLTAEGNVQIKDDTNTAYGEKGVYDVTAGIAVLTGSDLKLVSPDQTVTATERMEYHSNERLAKAIGNATVRRPKDTLKADTITAYFADDKAPATASASPNAALGGGKLDRLEGEGHVVITTPTEILYGNKAIYSAAKNTAELIGNVKIERGPNVLTGNRAEVDLATNISKLYGSEKEGGRVRGVFFPDSKNKSDNKGQDKKSPVPAPFIAAPATPPAAPSAVVIPPNFPTKPPAGTSDPAAVQMPTPPLDALALPAPIALPPANPQANTAVPAPAAPANVSRRIEY